MHIMPVEARVAVVLVKVQASYDESQTRNMQLQRDLAKESRALRDMRDNRDALNTLLDEKIEEALCLRSLLADSEAQVRRMLQTRDDTAKLLDEVLEESNRPHKKPKQE